MKSKTIKIAAGITISLVFLAGSLYKVDLRELLLSLKTIRYSSMALYILCFGLSCGVRALMWRITTAATMRIRLSTLYGGVIVGYLVSAVLPLRAGELYRAQYLSSLTGIRRTTAFSTIVIERGLDVFSLGLLLVVSLFLGVHGITTRAATVVLTVWVAMVLAAATVILKFDAFEKHKHRLAFLPHRVLDILETFLAPLSVLRNMRTVASLFLLSIIVWVCNYFALLGLVHDSVATARYEAALLLFLFLNIGMLIPAAPGSLGVVQMAFWMSLTRYGVSREHALAVSFAYLAASYLFTLGLGLPFFFKAHLKFGAVSEDVS